MSVFFLAEIQAISDENMYREYVQKAAPIIKKHGGEYIFKSEKLYPISGNWDLKRIILIRFASKENVRECFQSDDYKSIVHLRENSTVSKAMIIEQ